MYVYFSGVPYLRTTRTEAKISKLGLIGGDLSAD